MNDAAVDFDFPIDDAVGAWPAHGRFVVAGAPTGPLAGLRFAAKDLFDVAGHPTGGGNPTWLDTHPMPVRSSPVVDALLAAGATLAGKVITDELAYSLHGDNVHYGAPTNPRAPERVTGGSSSGSAAAVAARCVDFALGSDTGGSTRVPASYCGIFGLRTTHGLVSTEGMVGLHPSFDTATWFAHDPQTFERVAAVLLPPSPFEPRRLLRLADVESIADSVFAVPLATAAARLATLLGVETTTVDAAPGERLDDWRRAYGSVGAFEAWKLHGAWIAAHRPTFGAPIAARFSAAAAVDAAHAGEARAECARIRAQVRALVGDDAIVLLPSAASLAPRRDADPASVDAVRMRTIAITSVAGIAGLPQVSVPVDAGVDAPLGVSLLGPAGSDRALVSLARRLHDAMR